MKLASLLASALCASSACAAAPVAFHNFEYVGGDAIYGEGTPAGKFHNPILAGYYPDPSIVAVGRKFYLVNSTFAHYPGIPIHESTDLVHWKLIGHALTRPEQLKYDGLGISRGVFAPSIHFHAGVYYIINTLVDAGGNFFVTATDPRGPWSAPVWLPQIDGIDPSFFFDKDGKAYVLNNGGPEGKALYDGHRAIWMQEFDLATNKLTGPRKVLVNGGTDISKKPIWIEGPHLYRINGWYYLLCAEGGTGPGHSAVVFRSKSPWGPFESYHQNPILTQRDLPVDRANPVTNAGHADLVQARDGSWWAVFLASRPYHADRYNTGRETFLLPVNWKDGWPVILPQGLAIPTTLPAPRLAPQGKLPAYDLLSGNFVKSEEFDGVLGPEWLQIYTPTQEWLDLASMRGAALITPLKVNLDQKRNASFLARRQQHQRFIATTSLTPPADAGVAAGVAAYQNDEHWYFLGARRAGAKLQIFLERHQGKKLQIASNLDLDAPERLQLRITGNGDKYSFYYDAGQGWQPLKQDDDGSILSTEVAQGFVGTVLGPFARQE